MQPRRFFVGLVILVAVIVLSVAGARHLLAHCDGLDGPVVQAAKQALVSGNINLALIWVRPEDEAETRSAFRAAMSVRSLGGDAAALADRYFFETVVRLHRAGEGAAYTGLKPAGRDLGPAIPAADKALATGDIGALEELLVDALRDGLQAQFMEVQGQRRYHVNDLNRGREYVRAYVQFVHYVDRLHENATGPASGHFAEKPH